jgi:hypothetical protein
MRWPFSTLCDHRRRGQVLADVLAGAWRATPPAVQLTPNDLAAIVLLLRDSGCAGLGWWRLQRTPVGQNPALHELAETFRRQALRAALLERHLVQVVSVLRRAGIEPLASGGWAAARLYAVAGQRPFDHLTLAVPPGQLAAAAAALRALGQGSDWVRLCASAPELGDRSWSALLLRCRVIWCEGTAIRTLGPEDQLRQRCLQLLRCGARQPRALCDVAAAAERVGPDFDWECCLAGDPGTAEWVLSAVGLARRLLGAEVAMPPRQAGNAPAWLIDAVLRQWGTASAAPAVGCRWPNPIEAALRLGRRPTGLLPHVLFQFADYLTRVARRPVF